MGSRVATTYIKNIRSLLNETIDDALLTDANAGTVYTNTYLLECLNKAKDRYWEIVRRVREDYFQISAVTPLSFVTTTKEYSLASNFRQLVGIRVSTSGYEYIRFRRVDQNQKEFQEVNALPSSQNYFADEFLYDIVAGTTLKLANFPPVALTVPYDYIKTVSDFTLSGSSTTDIDDEHCKFVELEAAINAVLKDPTNKRLPAWRSEMTGNPKIPGLETMLIESVSRKNIRESKHVAPYSPR